MNYIDYLEYDSPEYNNNTLLLIYYSVNKIARITNIAKSPFEIELKLGIMQSIAGKFSRRMIYV